MKIKPWKIGLSVVIGVSIGLFLITNICKSNFGISTSITLVDTSVFYEGVGIIVLAIVLLCVVIIICTSSIIKAINSWVHMEK